MALPATVRKFEIALADADRGVYAELDWRVAQHPSESDRYLVARVLARALEHAEGLEFSRGGVSPRMRSMAAKQRACARPARSAGRAGRVDRDRYALRAAIDPIFAERVHKATKACARVAIYTWKDPERLAGQLAEVHRAGAVGLYALPAELLDAAGGTLARTNRWQLAVSGRVLYLEIGDVSVEGPVERVAILTS